jgi:Raf kinase inhibitor-like YbhB/YbcL family protein
MPGFHKDLLAIFGQELFWCSWRWRAYVLLAKIVMVSGTFTTAHGHPRTASEPFLSYSGEDVSPELHWTDQPPTAKSFALIVDGPDAPAGTWVHWVLFDLSGDAHDLSEAAGKRAPLPTGAQQGTNDFKKEGYGGPCPPPGKPHRYFFKFYALDSKLALKGSATKAEVEKAMQGHILGLGELIGWYGR